MLVPTVLAGLPAVSLELQLLEMVLLLLHQPLRAPQLPQPSEHSPLLFVALRGRAPREFSSSLARPPLDAGRQQSPGRHPTRNCGSSVMVAVVVLEAVLAGAPERMLLPVLVLRLLVLTVPPAVIVQLPLQNQGVVALPRQNRVLAPATRPS